MIARAQPEKSMLGFLQMASGSTAILIAFVAAGSVFAQSSGADNSGGIGSPRGASKIEFSTVAEALESVSARPGVKKEVVQGGWTILHQYRPDIVWSFAPNGHPAHPTVVKRVLVVDDENQIRIEMSALCGADKPACDKVVKEFEELNNRAAAAIRNKLNQK